jgi:hypothetical protein
MNFVGIFWLIALLSSAQGGDILDPLPTDMYWQARQVVVSPQAMQAMVEGSAADISPQIKQLSSEVAGEREAAIRAIAASGAGALPQLEELAKSDDPRLAKLAANLIQQIKRRGNEGRLNRLMAIRTLGELKHQEALPQLRKLTESKEAFVADYARRAIAQIEGQPLAQRPPSSKEDRERDLWLMPAGAGIVAQIDLTSASAPVAPREPAAAGPASPRALMMLPRSLRGLDEVGNMRIDRVTVAVSSTIGRRQGWFLLLGRGRYDHAALSDVFRKQGATVSSVEGMPVFAIGREVQFLLVDDTTFAFVARASDQEMPMAEFAAALKKGEGSLKQNEALVAALGAVDRSARLYGAAINSDAYRALPLDVPVPFDMLRLTGRSKDGKMQLRVEGDGNDAVAVAEAVTAYRALVQQAISGIEAPAQQVAAARAVQEFLKSIQLSVNEMQATVTAELDLGSFDAATLLGIR